jgi:hypothetical protein
MSRHAVLRGAVEGAGIGFLSAFACIGIGLVRAAFVLLSGRHLAPLTAQDARLFAFYVGGFVIAGVLIGAAGPFLPGRVGTYARFAFGGMVVTLAIVMGDQGSIAATDTADWIFVLFFGPLFGFAAAYGYLRG